MERLTPALTAKQAHEQLDAPTVYGKHGAVEPKKRDSADVYRLYTMYVLPFLFFLLAAYAAVTVVF